MENRGITIAEQEDNKRKTITYTRMMKRKKKIRTILILYINQRQGNKQPFSMAFAKLSFVNRL